MANTQNMPGATPDHASYRRGERHYLMLSLLLGVPLFLAVIACLPNAGPVLRLFNIPSASMVPTLYPGGLFVASRASYGYSRYSFDTFELPIHGRWPALMPQYGDVVAFRFSRDPKVVFVKRVVGLPGDRIQMIKGRLSINGQPVPIEAAGKVPDASAGKPELPTYIETLPNGIKDRIAKLEGDDKPYDNTVEYLVPPGHLFMLGDNRDNSNDSRMQTPGSGVGYVPIELVIGRVVLAF